MGAGHGGRGRHGVCMHWQVFLIARHDLALLVGNLHIPIRKGHPTVPVRSAIVREVLGFLADQTAASLGISDGLSG
eukprot:9814678-Alexandrium_andersonii.AAC.1